MISVAVVAYKRPHYLKRSLDALRACDGFAKDVDDLIISVDDAEGRGRTCASMVAGDTTVDKLVLQPKQRGIVGNTILTMKEAFDRGADSVLMLEDDGVLSTDALRLVRWFVDSGLPHLAFSLSAHGDNTEYGNDPGAVKEYNFLPCPFAYVVTRRHWPFMLKNWCCKEYHPCGWSWSMTHAARAEGLKFLSPRLSRCINIGREGGTNESPESWDESQAKVVPSDGSWRGSYKITSTITDEQAREVSDWMVPELEQNKSRKFDGWLGFGCPPEIESARGLL